MKSRLVLVMLVLAGAVSTAVAAPPWGQRGGPPAFTEIDANGDGVITETEYNGFRANRMAQRAAEGRPMRNAGRHPGFQAMDLNGDQVVDAQELAQWRAARRAYRR